MAVSNHQYLINRESALPAYQQIANNLIDRIRIGEWQPGDLLPGENHLAKDYGVSRVTIRQALNVLNAEDMVQKKQGVGTIIKPNTAFVMHNVISPSVDKTFSGNDPDIVSRDIQIVRTTSFDIAACAGIDLSACPESYYLRRIFVKNDNPIGFHQAWFPVDQTPNLDTQGLVENSISATLSQRYHLKIVQTGHNISTTKMDAVVADILGEPCETAALKINSIFYDADDKAIEYSSTIWTSKYTSLQLLLRREHNSRINAITNE